MLRVRPQGLVGRIADLLMWPVMKGVMVLRGLLTLNWNFLNESPQRTHLWNNHHLQPSETEYLSQGMMVRLSGDTHAISHYRLSGLRRHLTFTRGGWQRYVVIAPANGGVTYWHIGWRTGAVHGVSRLRVSGPVRVLLGPDDVDFFGMTSDSCFQIEVMKIGTGRLGDGNKEFQKLPLL